jgi:uncharacterized peroxidase-related enzyme
MESTKRYQTSLSEISMENATEAQSLILKGALKQMGFIPNLHKNMVNQPILLDTYLHGYKLFKQQSPFTPQEQEIIMIILSRENGCEYCVAAHTAAAHKVSNVPNQITEAIRDYGQIEHEKYKALVNFTSAMFHKRGKITREDSDSFFSAGYDDIHILSIILAIAIKTMSNYTNHIFGTELDIPFKSYAWQKKR